MLPRPVKVRRVLCVAVVFLATAAVALVLFTRAKLFREAQSSAKFEEVVRAVGALPEEDRGLLATWILDHTGARREQTCSDPWGRGTIVDRISERILAGEKDLVPVLVTCLRHPNEGVQGVAAQCLTRVALHCPQEVETALVPSLRNGRSAVVRLWGAFMLRERAEAGEPLPQGGAEALVHAVADDDPTVRALAIEALGHIRPASQAVVATLKAIAKEGSERDKVFARRSLDGINQAREPEDPQK